MSPLGYHSPFKTNDAPSEKDIQVGTPGNPKTQAVGSGARQMRAQAAALKVKLPKAKGK